MNHMKTGTENLVVCPAAIQQLVAEGKMARAQMIKDAFVSIADRLEHHVRAVRKGIAQPVHH